MNPIGKLSIREGETAAKFLTGLGNGKISASACRWKTPEDVARAYLGSRATDRAIKELAEKIRANIGH